MSTNYKIIALFVTALLLSGCASTKRMNKVSLGMTKAEVINAIGSPESSRASDGTEYLVYSLTEIPGGGTQAACAPIALMTLGMAYLTDECSGREDDYYVQLREGRVTGYGRMGDFDSTQNPESTININKKISVTED